jgi:hypothetical protein
MLPCNVGLIFITIENYADINLRLKAFSPVSFGTTLLTTDKDR